MINSNNVAENWTVFANPNALVAVGKGMQSVGHCSNKTLISVISSSARRAVVVCYLSCVSYRTIELQIMG